MAKRIFSPEQEKAIETKEKTLLVCAAAGSGKTTVLTERIIRSLLSKTNRESLENMLIVTFTNASVADLRDKIAKALTEAIKEAPDDKSLERELFFLPSARICTIDSFCNEIVKSNADRVGVTPGYRLAETAEAAILSSALLNGLIDAALEDKLCGIVPEEFEKLSDCLTSSKTSKDLSEVFLMLYEKSKSEVDGVAVFEHLANKYLHFAALNDFSVEKTEYGNYAILRLHEAVNHFVNHLSRLISESYDAAEEKYCQRIREDLILLRELSLAESYESLKAHLDNLSFAALPTVRGDKTPLQIAIKDAREDMKESILNLKKRFFSYTSDEWRMLYSELGSTLCVLAKFLSHFDKVYTEEKRRRGMLEYSDIERYAYLCLYTPDGVPSDIATAYQRSFTSVYIDEYQDVNPLQDRIFSAVASPTARFMVGDIKQSIYGFRSAKPDIFAEMKTSFAPIDESGESENASLFMSNNYRCDRGIIDFVNEIFDSSFKFVGKSIGYEDGDRLRFAKVYPNGDEPVYRPAKILIDAEAKRDENGEKINTTPYIAAKRIKNLLKEGRLASGEPYRPSDIAIIVRTRSKIGEYASALSELGIPCDTADEKSFFLNREVLITLCLLNAIDNPKKDIYLAGLLCSPLYGFSADEVLLYRKKSRTGSLYDAIVAYSAENPEDKKLSDFLLSLHRYRTLAEGSNVDSLISRLYRETGLLALASKHGGKDNLLLLYDYARKFEGSAYKGLYSFITYINNLIDLGKELGEKREGSESDAVKIVTAHSSKGLEYPAVFFDATYKLKNLDESERVAYSAGFGLSVCLRSKDGLALVNNPVQNIIRDRMHRKYFEEELRVLYVALTRAREELFVVGKCEDAEEFENGMALLRISLSEFSLRRAKSYQDIILSTTSIEPVLCLGEDGETTVESTPIDAPAPKQNSKSVRESLKEEIKARFNYSYPSPHTTTLPEKMSVSKLYPEVLDGSDGEPLIIEKEREKRGILPAFISGTHDDESARRGIITHTFMQFCDFERLYESGAKAELSRLVYSGFISKENEGRVRISEIEKFRSSPLFEKIRAARKLYREFRFNCFLPAEKFTTEKEKKEALKEEKILVQGVIDCIIEDSEGNLHLIDYKTDRLTKEELNSPALAKKRLSEKHSLQLYYYGLATEQIFGKKPSEICVYSLHLGATVTMEKPENL